MPTMAILPRASSSKPPANSLSGMLSTLIPLLIVAAIIITAFLLLRVRQRRIYQPRTYLGSFRDEEKTPMPSKSMFGWIPEFFRVPDEYVLNHHSLDGYFFLRFFKTLVLICLVGWPFTWIILMPVYATAGNNASQFDRLSFSNIDAAQHSSRYYATVFVSWVYIAFVMFIIAREIIHYIQTRQAFLLLPGVASRLSSRTVLFTNVPSDLLSEVRLRETFAAVRQVWICTDTSKLEDLVKDRQKAALKLESAEVALSRNALKARNKAVKKHPDSASRDGLSWINPKKRPTHRLKPLIGKKVDTIEWCRSFLGESKISEEQTHHLNGTAKKSSAAFVEFDNVQAAESAFHRTGEAGVSLPKGFQPRAVGARPDEVVWSNLNISESQRKIRTAIAITLIVLMIIFWLPIVAFIGLVTNVNKLYEIAPPLLFLKQIPGPIIGIITGLLPVIVLAVVMSLVPVVIRLLFKLGGAATTAEVELKTQSWYFAFQVIQVFIVTTLASGATSAISTIKQNPAQAPTLLATALPSSANFYINYFILYGIATASKTVFNIVAVALYNILGKFLDKTPRKMFRRYTTVASLGWGSVYPVFICLGVIALTYSCIAPLVLGFATLGFLFLYLAFRYNMIYALDVTRINTHGQSYAKAMNQLTTGVYLLEVCLIGLFAIATATSKIAVGCLVLMIIFLVVTALFHMVLNRTIASLEKAVSRNSGASVPPSTGAKEMSAMTPNQTAAPAHGGAESQSGTTNSLRHNRLVRLLHLPPVPTFDGHLSALTESIDHEDYQRAYVDPSVSDRTPLIWIAQDPLGISTREVAETKKFVPCTDEGAWFDEKSGKLMTDWVAQPADDGTDYARKAPIWEQQGVY